MLLHELTITAVGPFADRQVIDFDRLGAVGLFLLEGPTGVGKSTILDALTFALYGTGGAAGRLVSDFADASAEPSVALEFSVRGRRQRIVRTPKYERRKQRGSGTVTQNATAQLSELRDGQWMPRSAAVAEIGTIVADELGLTREQFRQVVLLPQGEFAAFLRADDDGRRTLLTKLFGTHLYAQITETIQRRAQAEGKRLDEIESSLTTSLAKAWEAAGRDEPEAEEGDLSWSQRVDDIASVLGQIERSAREARELSRRRQAEEDRLRTFAEDSRALAERVSQRAEVEAELAAMQADRAQQEARTTRLDLARRAAPVRSLLAQLAKARAGAAATWAALTSAQLGEHAETAGDTSAQFRLAASAAQQDAAALSHLVLIEGQLEADQAALAEHEAHARAHADDAAALGDRIAEIPGELSVVEGALAAAAEAARVGQDAGERLDEARARHMAARSVAELHEEVEHLRERQQEARRAREDAVRASDELLERRLTGLKAELSGLLVPGEPCSVCGSTEHPAPAEASAAQVTRAQVRKAGRVKDEAMAAVEAATAALAEASARLAAQQALAGGATAEQAQQAVDQLQGAVELGVAAQLRVTELDAERRRLQQSADRLGAERVDLTQRAATEQAKVDAEKAALGGRREQVLAAQGEDASVAERQRRLRDEALAASRAAEVLEAHARADTHLREAEQGAHVEATESGFADVAQAEAASLDREALRELEREVTAWQGRYDAARRQLAEARMAEVAGLDPARIQTVAALAADLVETAAEDTARADQRAAVAEQQAQRLGARLGEVRAAEERRADIAPGAEELRTLDYYCRAIGTYASMSLSTFVLQFWFDQVIAEANVRLGTMSAGKYELVRSDAKARRNARTGLGLAIFDRHTGKERGTDTLSGGETFYTSLSLALGLADVVMSQAGGAQLDTLFIDEGFGTLDPDTLDEVMSAIDELRDYGRVIGIVSHVAELKERVPERLSIRRVRPDGPSRVEVVA